MLAKWINPDMDSKLPGYASHYVGVGGMVLNKNKEKLLCIQEQNIGKWGRYWKMPGGLVDAGESI